MKKNTSASEPTTNKTKEIFNWIDTGKGLSMLMVIFYHCEVSGVFNQARCAFVWFPFFMTFFFFMSGFLFHKGDENFDVKKKIKSIVTKLLWSYFVFTFIIVAPKSLTHGTNILDGILGIFLGRASWFVATLIVAELLLLPIFKYNKSSKKLFFISLVMMAISLWVYDIIPSQPWHYNKGFSAAAYMIWGYLTYLNRNKLQKFIKPITMVLLLVFYGVVRYLDYKYWGIKYSMPQDVSLSSIIFIFESVLGVSLMFVVCNLLPRISLLHSIGRNSLIYYYLNGGVVVVLTTLFLRFGFCGYGYVLLMFVLATAILSFAAQIINKYCPFMVQFPSKKHKILRKI